MEPTLAIFINNQLVFNYSKNTRLPGRQREFLIKMDQDMDAGIQLGEEFVSTPNQSQRVSYVAMQLLNAWQHHNQAMLDAMSAWLTSRVPELQKILAEHDGETTSFELVFDN